MRSHPTLLGLFLSGTLCCSTEQSSPPRSEGCGTAIAISLGECTDPVPNSHPDPAHNGECNICDAGFIKCGATACDTNAATDAQNCGTCGNACAGGKCDHGSCFPVETIASDLSFPASVVVDWSSVYVATSGRILQMPKTCGDSVSLALEVPVTSNLALDAFGLYWLAESAPATQLVTARRPDFQVQTLAGGDAVIDPALSPTLITDTTAAYWFSGETKTGAKVTLWKASKWSVGKPTALARFDPGSFLAPEVLAADYGDVFFTAFDNAQFFTDIVVVPLGASSGIVLATEENVVVGIAVDSTYVYWWAVKFTLSFDANPPPPPGFLRKVPRTGGPVVDIWHGTDQLSGLTVADGALFGADLVNGTIVRVALDTGKRTIVAGAQGPLGGFAVDDGSSVYWTTADSVLRATVK